jgi:hypothetical protein
MTQREWTELSTPHEVLPTRSLVEKVLGFVLWIVVAVFCAGMAGACYLGSTGMTGNVRGVTLAGMALLSFAALAAFVRALWSWMPAKRRVVPAAVLDRKATWDVVEINVLEAWQIDTGDDDVPTLLLRCDAGGYVSMYGGILDELWAGDAEDAWESVGAIVRLETIGQTERITSTGPRVSIRGCGLAEPWPRRGVPWWAQPLIELREADLGAAWQHALRNAAPRGMASDARS